MARIADHVMPKRLPLPLTGVGWGGIGVVKLCPEVRMSPSGPFVRLAPL
jgi:hypothetical protein